MNKEQENYIEHEVKIRVHKEKFDLFGKAIERLDLDLKHLDNKFMLMFTLILGSIWLPAILHYLKVI